LTAKKLVCSFIKVNIIFTTAIIEFVLSFVTKLVAIIMEWMKV